MMEEKHHTKQFPAGKVPLGDASFRFACHSGVACYKSCCRQLELHLYPYDIIRLKTRLGIGSEKFLRLHTMLGLSHNPYFPGVRLRMLEDTDRNCPFLSEHGCRVYESRPTACRTYPLERAVDRTPSRGRPTEYYFLTDHPYCLGHYEERSWTVQEWLRDQQLFTYNTMNDLWAEVDTLFAANPWQGEGAAGPKQQLAFMVCYNIDGFRDFVRDHNLLGQFRLEKSRIRLIRDNDEALLTFGFDWLKYVLQGNSVLRPKR
jgi:Fe-S-cluster containining protein